MRAAAFFDLDRTLIPFNSGMRYARWEHKAGRLATRHLVQSAVWLSLYHLSLVDMARDAEGRLTGRVDRPICYGPGKVEHARRWAADHGIDLGASWFYSDSRSDLPMLEAVGSPEVVNPDPRLGFVARRRGWPIHRWDRARRP